MTGHQLEAVQGVGYCHSGEAQHQSTKGPTPLWGGASVVAISKQATPGGSPVRPELTGPLNYPRDPLQKLLSVRRQSNLAAWLTWQECAGKFKAHGDCVPTGGGLKADAQVSHTRPLASEEQGLRFSRL